MFDTADILVNMKIEDRKKKFFLDKKEVLRGLIYVSSVIVVVHIAVSTLFTFANAAPVNNRVDDKVYSLPFCTLSDDYIDALEEFCFADKKRSTIGRALCDFYSSCIGDYNAFGITLKICKKVNKNFIFRDGECLSKKGREVNEIGQLLCSLFGYHNAASNIDPCRVLYNSNNIKIENSNVLNDIPSLTPS